ncbi:SPX domain-containing protein [Mariannaea sp. PMI_226]|nr:SPX domain-containing protein [Mariannaea sp. PMI_226]
MEFWDAYFSHLEARHIIIACSIAPSTEDPTASAITGSEPDVGEEYELVDYPPISAQHQATEREIRVQEKRDKKRRWLEEQDEMKFSHSIQFNAVPDWSSYYIAYSNLKKLIYQLEKSVHQTRSGDAESRPLIGRKGPEEIFSKALNEELDKICKFYASKERELFDELAQLLQDIDDECAIEDRPYLRRLSSDAQRTLGPRSRSPHSRSSDNDSGSDEDETTGLTKRRNSGRKRSSFSARGLQPDMSNSMEFNRSARRQSAGEDFGDQSIMFSSGLFSSSIMLKKRIIGLYVSLCELKSYVQLNRTGFNKVLKKFDKILDKELKSGYIEAHVESAYPFKEDTKRVLEENIAKMEEAYASVVTNGDEDLARKDLRSHLREHVVWERNTVWRDLIGIERRAEAAGLAQALLGQDRSRASRRLQGDEAKALPTAHIRTPFGSITLPPWLASSSFWVLIICVAIFFALLSLPLMENPEQQNCLAMLVFVSLMWATETLPLFVTAMFIPFLSVLLNVVRDETPGKPPRRLNSKEATKEIFAAMWTPVIMLLIGGFTLAAALSKCTIDKRLATLVLSKAGTDPKIVLLANMFVAAFASMLISNVAAPVLCYSIIEPMLRTLPSDSNMSKALIIGIALASNIGGMLSPIASPQNVVAMGIMQPAPTWLQWFFIVIPVGAVSIVSIWLLLIVTFQPGKGTTIAPIRPVKEKFTALQWFVSIVTVATIALWCASHQLEDVFGDMGVIAIIPIVLFFGIGILTNQDFNNFPWTIIILAAGGLSLGKAVRSSGLLHTLAEIVSQKVEGMSVYGVLIVFSSLILVIATFISHTVAALIFLPLVFDVGHAMEQPHPNLLVMGGVLMCSAAMGLPTSGFPNMNNRISLELAVVAMLSAFTARPIIELRQRDKSKIETILAYGDRVLVGLNSGTLRVYRLNEFRPEPPNGHASNNNSDAAAAAAATPPTNGTDTSTKPPVKPTDLLREVERFSTRAIEQLAIIKEANTIVSLSNWHIHLHDLQTYQHIETLSRTKNASCFAVTSNIVKDPDTGIPEIISRLAVAVKRRLLLWSWHESELSEDVGEVVLAESIRSLTWANATKLVCGMNGGYVMVNVVTHEIEEIVSPGSGPAAGQTSRFGAMSSAGMGYMGLGGYMPKPLVAKLADGEMLLAKDINTLFIDDNGKPLEKRQIPWQSAPDSIGYSYPYILALQPPSKGSLEVRNPNTLVLLQSLSLPGAAQLYFPPPTVSLAHAGKGFHISSERCVWKMGATDYDSQIQELVDGEKFDEAISILGMLEDALLKNKVETLREVKMLKAEMLFKKKRYRQSMDLFNETDVHAPPERVLKLYPPEIAGELSAWSNQEEEQEQEEDKAGEEGEEEQRESGEETPDKESPSTPKQNGSRTSTDTQEGIGESAASPNIGGFAKLLMGGHRKLMPDTASIASSKKDSVDAADTGSVKENPREDGPLEGKDLMNAVLELNSYLVGTRTRLQALIDPVTGNLRPKTERSDSSEDIAENFLKLGLNDSEKKQEEELRETFRLVDTTLFRAYMYSRPTLAGSLFRIPNFCDPEVVNEKLLEHNRYTELVDFFNGKKLHKEALQLLQRFGSAEEADEAAPTLHGPGRTIQYLKNLPPSELSLILEYAEWTFKTSPDIALEIFTGDTENAESLPREDVVVFLRKVDTRLEGKYLEHIINELEDMTPDLHNRLVELYVQNLREMEKNEDWDALMVRFLAFLREARQVYSLSKAFQLIPKDDSAFYEAQAVVLSNMGQHKQALEIYVFKMKDYSKAEDYCNRVHKSHESASPPKAEKRQESEDPEDAAPSIYHTLLSLYLQPAPPNKPNLEPALDLLSKHGSRLPATSTLGLIPDDLPVSSLESYFRGRIRSANTLVNEARIVAGLRKAEGISIAARLHLGDDTVDGQGGRNRHVTITEERHCVITLSSTMVV